MPNEPLIQWPKPLLELVTFLAGFLSAGAVGFRFAALRGLLRSAVEGEREFARAAARSAARNGLVGALIAASLLALRLPEIAGRQHLSVLGLVTTQPPMVLQVGLLLAALAGFGLATRGVGFGWGLAAIGVLVSPARAAFFGQFERAVNPMHMLAGGLWIGTLAMVVFAGIMPALRHLAPERRGPVVAGLVNGFSPLALGGAALLAVMGVTTAWLHLKRLDALWTTPYGFTLIAKLCVVAVVVGLGALNWRRRRPRLGGEAAAIAIRRSATGELIAAGVVLLITAVLVSLPSPK